MEQLLATKLYVPPVRPEFVSRPRPIQKLNKGLHRKVTLLSAPAGFGKTTLVSEWMGNLKPATPNENQTEYRVAWLSLMAISRLNFELAESLLQKGSVARAIGHFYE